MYVSDLLDLVSPWSTFACVEGKKLDVCHSRLPEKAFASTRTAKNGPWKSRRYGYGAENWKL